MEIIKIVIKISFLLSLFTSITNSDPAVPSEVIMICEYSMDSFTNLYTCRLSGGALIYPNQTLRIEGQHLENKTDADVKVVTPPNADTTLRYFNGEIMDKFINLEILQLFRTGLRGISQNAFNSCGRLEQFQIAVARMETFPRGLLSNCRNLKRFIVDISEISTLPSDLFGNTQNLEVFTFVQSNLTSLPANLFQNMRNLWFVDLSQNPLTTLSPSLFSNVINLERINLFLNRISDPNVIVNVLNGQTGLRSIDLSRSGFSNFDFNFFSQFNRLEWLLISPSDWFTDIAWNGLPESLVELRVEGIGEQLPERALNYLRNLRSLSLSGHRIQIFHQNTFSTLTNLQALSLASCGITHLHPEQFSTLINLNLLNLNFNNIDYLPEGVFASLENLGTMGGGLTMNNNVIHELNANSFGIHPNLSTLAVHNNWINAIEREIFLMNIPRLAWFHAFSNRCVNEIISGMNIANNPELEHCFANWRGDTTSTTTTTTTDGSERMKGNLIVLIGVWVVLIKI